MKIQARYLRLGLFVTGCWPQAAAKLPAEIVALESWTPGYIRIKTTHEYLYPAIDDVLEVNDYLPEDQLWREA